MLIQLHFSEIHVPSQTWLCSDYIYTSSFRKYEKRVIVSYLDMTLQSEECKTVKLKLMKSEIEIAHTLGNRTCILIFFIKIGRILKTLGNRTCIL